MRLPAILFASVLTLSAGATVAHSAPAERAGQPNHGQCVSESATPSGKGGRSALAKDKAACQEQATRLSCLENEDGGDTVRLDSLADTVQITGSGPGSAGSSLACATSIEVAEGDTISADYVFAEGTDPCGGGVPRLYAVVDGEVYNTFDDNPNTCEATSTSVALPDGTVTEVGFVYDRGDTGTVTYSNAQVGGVTLNL